MKPEPEETSSGSGDDEEPESDMEGEEELLALSSDELDEMLGISEEQQRGEEPDDAGVKKTDAQPRVDGVRKGKRARQEEDAGTGVADGDEGQAEAGSSGQVPGKAKVKAVLSRDHILRMNARAEGRGVVYISRIPPHMKPAKLRQLLGAHGELGRIYCAPEDKALRWERRKRNGGKDTGKSFTEGWVEFEDKRVARRTAAMLNGQPIGGKKRSAYYFDLWCLKYLPKFRWDHLTEEINYQRAVREQRLAAEISSAKRERDFYLSRVDRAKAVEAIRERKKSRGAAGDAHGAQEERAGGGAGDEGAASGATKPGEDGRKGRPERVRHVHQIRSKPEGLEAGTRALPDDVLDLVAARRR